MESWRLEQPHVRDGRAVVFVETGEGVPATQAEALLAILRAKPRD